jgi:hypothetical protein
MIAVAATDASDLIIPDQPALNILALGRELPD